MTVGNAIVQGIVQGFTEFLPVSSSGHLSLIQYFTGQGVENGLLFSVLLHLGTLLAVFLAFWSTVTGLIAEFFRMLADLLRGRFSWKRAGSKRRMVLLLMLSLLPMILTVFLKDWFASLATDGSLVAEGVCFLLTSLLLFVSGRWEKGHKTAKSMTPVDALAIGAMQSIAPLPGLSRSGSTISVGLLMGLERRYAVAFSFIMGIPAVLGANILEIGDAVKEGVSLSLPVMLVGIVCSLISGILAIRLVRWLAVSDKFKYFAWYTLVLGIAVLIAAAIEQFSGGVLRSIVMGG